LDDLIRKRGEFERQAKEFREKSKTLEGK
jgi:hypothetical protein